MKIKTYKIKRFEKIDSTHIYSKQNKENLESKTVIIANMQTNGIGTHGRSWYTGNDKNIAMSIIYKPNCNISLLKNLTIDISKCIQKAIKDLHNIELIIKEPNDLFLNSKKICGILIEVSTIKEIVNCLIISIGFNVNEDNFSKDISNIATSLKKELNKNFNKNEIVEEIIKNINLTIENLTSQNNEKK